MVSEVDDFPIESYEHFEFQNPELLGKAMIMQQKVNLKVKANNFVNRNDEILGLET